MAGTTEVDTLMALPLFKGNFEKWLEVAMQNVVVQHLQLVYTDWFIVQAGSWQMIQAEHERFWQMAHDYLLALPAEDVLRLTHFTADPRPADSETLEFWSAHLHAIRDQIKAFVADNIDMFDPRSSVKIPA